MHIPPHPRVAIVLNFGMWGDIANITTHANFFCQSVQWFWGSDPQNFAISIGLAGQSYNSVRTAMLHCDENRKQPLQL